MNIIHNNGPGAFAEGGYAAIVQHNTEVFRIKVYYRYHPYYGQELDMVSKPNNGDELITVYIPDKGQQKIPRWMVLPQASRYVISSKPHIHFKALHSVQELIRHLV